LGDSTFGIEEASWLASSKIDGLVTWAGTCFIGLVVTGLDLGDSILGSISGR
jgi:hypothetical protein